jgi:lysine 6-dehydrogenase
MSYRYVVLGAGRQGVAAAYDMARYGGAKAVILADLDPAAAQAGAQKVNGLLGRPTVAARQVDAADEVALSTLLAGADSALSTVPPFLNVGISRAAIAARTHLCDLGGEIEFVWQQLALEEAARAAGVSIIPDCGLLPGMGNTLAVYAMQQMDQPREVRIWVGGLPQNPSPPFNYGLYFPIEGLTMEYDGTATILRDGRRTELPPFAEVEEVEFPEPLGRCEAFITTAGASTCPWTYEGLLEVFEEKTVRYPGHAAMFKAYHDLGLFGKEPVEIEGQSVVPQALYHALLEPRLQAAGNRDVVVLRVSCRGTDQGIGREVTIELMDSYDNETGFSAMERTTAFPAAIVAQLMAQGETPRGAVRLELGVPPAPFLSQAGRRGFSFAEKTRLVAETQGVSDA